MKQYRMASIPNPSIVKQPLKTLELPLNKFSEEVIPHHQRALELHRRYVQKLISLNNVDQLAKEIKEKKRMIKQLRDLLYELDTLRTQVEDNDLDAFDSKTMPLRSAILKMTKAYQDLEKAADKLTKKDESPEDASSTHDRVNPFEGASQIQIEGDLNDFKLLQEQDRLNRVQEIEKNTQDLHEIYTNLHGMVGDQGESVTQVEENVASAHEHVERGFRDIVKAHKLKSVAYPATGAFVGTLLGGPIGLIAGLKVGGLAAIGCAFAGYAGGRFLKKQNDNVEDDADHVINNENNENHTVTEIDKKDI